MDRTRIQATPVEIEQFCRERHITRLAFFGSVLRDDFGPDSDIDVLVEFAPGHTPGFDFFKMEDELTELLGRKVDLQTAGFLGPRIYESVLPEVMTAYEQA